ncbi:MAG: hypothetical protein M1820_004666 [Bogoriella megaspora]|nr:MAG: hypothetical protein M1820_004666 [Bogoriella megaspora]
MTTSTLGVPESSSMSPIPPTSTSNSANRAHGLSSGAQAGIAIGTIMFVALTGTVVFFIWRRMRARKLNELLAVEVGKKRTEDDNGGTVMSELHGASMMSPKSHDAGNQSYQSCRSSSQQTSIPENSRISGPTLNNELFLPASDQLEVRRPHVFITNPDEPPKVDLPAQLTTETPVILGTGHQSFPVSPQGVAGTSINGSRNGDSQAEGSQTAFTISELHEEERWLDEQIEEAKRATNPAREIKRSPSVPCQSRREQDEITPVD